MTFLFSYLEQSIGSWKCSAKLALVSPVTNLLRRRSLVKASGLLIRVFDFALAALAVLCSCLLLWMSRSGSMLLCFGLCLGLWLINPASTPSHLIHLIWNGFVFSKILDTAGNICPHRCEQERDVPQILDWQLSNTNNTGTTLGLTAVLNRISINNNPEINRD